MIIRVDIIDSDNRDYVTSIKSISVVDESYTLIIIFKAFSLLEKWVINELPADIILTYNELDYSNDKINL